MTSITIKDTETVEIRALTVEGTDDGNHIKVSIRLKKRGERDDSAVKFAFYIPQDLETSGSTMKEIGK
jgi:hypothetical protein